MYLNEHLYSEMSLVNDLIKAINGQYSAVVCYEKLAQKASSAEERERILEIRNDEIRHLETFSQIYTTITGKQFTPQVTEKCAEEYCEGLKEAFIDEQETVDFYYEIADKASDKYIKEQFQRAAADEQNHAVWFSYFYFKKCR